MSQRIFAAARSTKIALTHLLSFNDGNLLDQPSYLKAKLGEPRCAHNGGVPRRFHV